MKYFLCLILTQLHLYAYAGEIKRKLFPNLPVGEFKVNIIAILNCESTSDIMYNIHLHKTSANSIEFRGNITHNVEFDDSFLMNINMAVKDSIGGWKDNAHVYKTPKACSALKSMMGRQWSNYLRAFNFNNTNCPLPKGVFVSKGFDVTRVIDLMNGPKTFFYGTYKCRLFFTDRRDKVIGCIVYVIEIKRPWETT